jgi:hypothetical protein
MPDTDTKTPTRPTEQTETEEPEVEEVPWEDRDVDLLAIALQRVGPFFLGNDVRSAESARKVALDLLQVFLDMGYEQPKPAADFQEYVDTQLSPYLDELANQRSGNARRPPTTPEHTPTPTEQVATQRRKDDETADDGKSENERRAERLRK